MRPHVYTHIRTTVFLYVYCVLLTLWIPADPAAKGNVCNSEAARLKHERASTSQQHYAGAGSSSTDAAIAALLSLEMSVCVSAGTGSSTDASCAWKRATTTC